MCELLTLPKKYRDIFFKKTNQKDDYKENFYKITQTCRSVTVLIDSCTLFLIKKIQAKACI